MKKLMKNVLILALGTIITIGCFGLVGCDNEEIPVDPVSPGGDDSFNYAGGYTLVEGDITYLLKVLANEDYELAVTRQFDGYTATKYYAGPLKDINGATMATMPVFLSDFYYDGNNSPNDLEELSEKLSEQYAASKGETEESRFYYIVLDKSTMTFARGTQKADTKLDPTEGYWTLSDFETGFNYAGDYTLVEGDITYLLKVLANEDYELAVTRQFNGYTATKYYAGPLKDINGATMATMPVFLSDFYYDGNNFPKDDEQLYEKLNEAYSAQKGETEESRFYYIVLDRSTMTFARGTQKADTKLDPTEGYWTISDFAE